MTQARWRRVARLALRVIGYGIATILILVAVAALLIRIGWANDQIRRQLLAQANRYLDGTLDIGRIEGSLLGEVRFVDVRLTHGGAIVVAMDELSVSYGITELLADSVTIRRLKLTRPTITLARQPDGGWNVANLIRRRGAAGPSGRPIRMPSIEIVDGTVTIAEPLTLGAARVPTRFEDLDVSAMVDYENGAVRLTLDGTSWTGADPDLTVTDISGRMGIGPSGWTFDDFAISTPSSSFILDGRINRGGQPTTLDLAVHAGRFAFQEWSGIVAGLSSIAVNASFESTLSGPASQLKTTIDLKSDGGDITGTFVLDDSVPGWHGRGEVTLARFDLAHWLNRTDQPSDISGRVSFDMDLLLGRGFPRTEGSYAFDGGRVAIFGYEAARLQAHGTTTSARVEIAGATAVAYGGSVRVTAGSVGFDAPFSFRFAGSASSVDLRRVPGSVPVPHVESTLAFDYDVNGRFRSPFLRGEARFAPSTFLGATVGDGSVGTIDTSVQPFRYSGNGDIQGLSTGRFGTDLDVGWMRAPAYDGTIGGRFQVEGTGGDPAMRRVAATGRLDRADVFGGTLSDADVSLAIAEGSLSGTFDGRFEGVNPAIAFDDARLDASLSGSGRLAVVVSDLLLRAPTLDDYVINSSIALAPSTVRGLEVARAEIEARLASSTLTVASAAFSGPILDAVGHGTIELDGVSRSRFDYDVTRADLSLVAELSGRQIAGEIVTSGQLTGPIGEMRLIGQGRLGRLELRGLAAMNLAGDYEVTAPIDDLTEISGRVTIEADVVRAMDRDLRQIMIGARLSGRALSADVWFTLSDGVRTFIHGASLVHEDRRGLDLSALDVTLLGAEWRLTETTPPPTVTWAAAEVAVSGVEFRHGTNERITVSGTWRPDGGGALRIGMTDVFADTFAGLLEGPARFGGVINLEATVAGTRASPSLAARVFIVNGRVRRLSYERLAGRVDFADGMATVDLRLDQGPGVWIAASGEVPLALFDRGRPERPLRVSLTSSPVDLGLIEGVTDVVRDVSGQVQFDLMVVGTSLDPHFVGSVKMIDARFQVTGTGTRYRQGAASILLDRDRVTVDALRIVDAQGQTLDIRGSIGTHELKVGDISIDVSARDFEVLNNEYGHIDVNASVAITGQFESPRISGDVTVTGGEIRVDTIFERMLLGPYSTTALSNVPIDALVALNPWERLGLGIFLHVPGTLRLLGENLQVSEGTPIGLGSFNLRATGDPYLYKDPAQPLYVTGSLDQITGTYAFQGRRFDMDPESSINFRGDVSPDVWVRVRRVVSAVETVVTIQGSISEPELQLTSTPPLDPSDILSLIVFNTTSNQLSAQQQQELAIRAGTLAAGFLAAPLLSALERSIGIDTLEIGPGTLGADVRVTIGGEIAPGLIARFSREFGDNQYDEAQIEYYLSRIFRIRATFSDAGSLVARSPFRRVERAGIDLLLFFSF